MRAPSHPMRDEEPPGFFWYGLATTLTVGVIGVLGVAVLVEHLSARGRARSGETRVRRG